MSKKIKWTLDVLGKLKIPASLIRIVEDCNKNEAIS